MKDLKRLGVKQYPRTSVFKISEGIITLESIEERKISAAFPCDTIVLAVGARPNRSLADELRTYGIESYCIGDAAKVGNIMAAIQQAKKVADEI